MKALVSFPHVLGHEVVGRRVDTGQRVVLNPWTPPYFKELRVIGSNGFGVEEVGGVAKLAVAGTDGDR